MPGLAFADAEAVIPVINDQRIAQRRYIFQYDDLQGQKSHFVQYRVHCLVIYVLYHGLLSFL